jgi:hypothetical protein
MKTLTIVLFLISFSAFSQTKGVVKDSLSGKPIPFVNIWVENENIGGTSEENGEFTIHTSEKSKNLIFSAIGYQKKKLPISKVNEVALKPTEIQLDEVLIIKSFGTKQKEIGQTESAVLQTFDVGPRIDTKFFPYSSVYKKTKFIKQITLQTDSAIENATLKIHLYSVNEKGFPDQELLKKDLIVTIKKGSLKTQIDILNRKIVMPKKGIFVAIEKLLIESNKVEKTTTNYNTKTTETKTTYYPLILYNRVDRDFLFMFSGGKWIRQSKEENSDSSGRMMIYEPSINLILTN